MCDTTNHTPEQATALRAVKLTGTLKRPTRFEPPEGGNVDHESIKSLHHKIKILVRKWFSLQRKVPPFYGVRLEAMFDH